MNDKNRNFDDQEENLLIDPDPFTVFLGVLGFLGSVASIAGYVEFKRNQRRERHTTQTKVLRELRDLLMSLETDTMQTEASLRKLEFILIEGTTETHSKHISKIRLEFGSYRPIFTHHGYKQFDDIVYELNRLTGKSFETTSRILQRLYKIDLYLDEEMYHGLIELQNRLNHVLREKLTYEDGFRVYYEIVTFTKDIIREIRNVVNRRF